MAAHPTLHSFFLIPFLPSFPLSSCLLSVSPTHLHLTFLTCAPNPRPLCSEWSGGASEQTARSPSAHPQSSAVSRPLPEAICPSHKHTHIHWLLFYLLVTLSSLLLILPSPSFPLLSLPLFPSSPLPPFILTTEAFPLLFVSSSSLLSFLFPHSLSIFEAMQYLWCGLLMLRQWTGITGICR